MPCGLSRFDLDGLCVARLDIVALESLRVEVIGKMVNSVRIRRVGLQRASVGGHRAGVILVHRAEAVSERIELLHKVDPHEGQSGVVRELAGMKQGLGRVVAGLWQVGVGVVLEAREVMLEEQFVRVPPLVLDDSGSGGRSCGIVRSTSCMRPAPSSSATSSVAAARGERRSLPRLLIVAASTGTRASASRCHSPHRGAPCRRFASVSASFAPSQ